MINVDMSPLQIEFLYQLLLIILNDYGKL
jgi:hypothetical protein